MSNNSQNTSNSNISSKRKFDEEFGASPWERNIRPRRDNMSAQELLTNRLLDNRKPENIAANNLISYEQPKEFLDCFKYGHPVHESESISLDQQLEGPRQDVTLDEVLRKELKVGAGIIADDRIKLNTLSLPELELQKNLLEVLKRSKNLRLFSSGSDSLVIQKCLSVQLANRGPAKFIENSITGMSAQPHGPARFLFFLEEEKEFVVLL